MSLKDNVLRNRILLNCYAVFVTNALYKNCCIYVKMLTIENPENFEEVYPHLVSYTSRRTSNSKYANRGHSLIRHFQYYVVNYHHQKTGYFLRASSINEMNMNTEKSSSVK